MCFLTLVSNHRGFSNTGIPNFCLYEMPQFVVAASLLTYQAISDLLLSYPKPIVAAALIAIAMAPMTPERVPSVGGRMYSSILSKTIGEWT